MNTASRIQPISASPALEEQYDEARAYLEKHKIPAALEQITQALVYERPSNWIEYESSHFKSESN